MDRDLILAVDDLKQISTLFEYMIESPEIRSILPVSLEEILENQDVNVSKLLEQRQKIREVK